MRERSVHECVGSGPAFRLGSEELRTRTSLIGTRAMKIPAELRMATESQDRGVRRKVVRAGLGSKTDGMAVIGLDQLHSAFITGNLI